MYQLLLLRLTPAVPMERVEQEIKVEVNIVHYSTNMLFYRHSISTGFALYHA